MKDEEVTRTAREILEHVVRATETLEATEKAAVLTVLSNSLKAELCDAVGAVEEKRQYLHVGCTSTAEFLKAACHYSGREASALVSCATLFREHLPRTRVALREGRIGWSHATTMVRTVKRLGIGPVAEAEPIWIDSIATDQRPEALQRVARARVVEAEASSQGSISTAIERSSRKQAALTPLTRPTAPTSPRPQIDTPSSTQIFLCTTRHCIRSGCTSAPSMWKFEVGVRWRDGQVEQLSCHVLACDHHGENVVALTSAIKGHSGRVRLTRLAGMDEAA
ncbi:hypothetical protein GCM10010174_35740 [Kutzneria viridogrisea]|nr:DUF222 domain-containing protein [Kutzneria albida]MBA8927785.1 hypothetical protein [Kutzneria viridogrisea]